MNCMQIYKCNVVKIIYLKRQFSFYIKNIFCYLEIELKMESTLHDLVAIQLSDPITSCEWFVQNIKSSTSHQSASSSFHLLRIMLMTSSIIDQSCLDNKSFVNVLINSPSLMAVLERFLQVGNSLISL